MQMCTCCAACLSGPAITDPKLKELQAGLPPGWEATRLQEDLQLLAVGGPCHLCLCICWPRFENLDQRKACTSSPILHQVALRWSDLECDLYDAGA